MRIVDRKSKYSKDKYIPGIFVSLTFEKIVFQIIGMTEKTL